jgi:hypothetical protein
MEEFKVLYTCNSLIIHKLNAIDSPSANGTSHDCKVVKAGIKRGKRLRKRDKHFPGKMPCEYP